MLMLGEVVIVGVVGGLIAVGAMLGVTLLVAWRFMHDIGFKPDREASPGAAVRTVMRGAINGGLRNPPVRWLMLAAPFMTGVGFYVFYAIQPYLLELYGDPNAYSVAGIAAALFAGASMVGGLLVPWARRLFRRRTTALVIGILAEVVFLGLIGVTDSFVVAIAILTAASILSPVVRSPVTNSIPSLGARVALLSTRTLLPLSRSQECSGPTPG